ncbi:hypothetical protein EV664_11853 [Stakelama pacifica]|uniref:Uncharacterized protein n=1 Tax=Stakelama pacifica TaxID=517720 RepID=A0A4R6FDC0_9SPHN|nr:hypothetical protein EV664_11853 [Stakelama pacifica]
MARFKAGIEGVSNQLNELARGLMLYALARKEFHLKGHGLDRYKR